jgi:glycerol-3-phosphate dehydrogenase
MHPYFFEGVTLPTNIELVSDANTKLSEIDIIISIIPCQFVG